MGSITGGILINTFHPTKKRPASSSINVDQFPFCGKFSSSIHITCLVAESLNTVNKYYSSHVLAKFKKMHAGANLTVSMVTSKIMVAMRVTL